MLPNDDAYKWRCPDCVEHALQPDNTETAVARRRSSAPKFTTDLLPAQRGSSKPDSHSVFNNLILDDDPLDGSRSLRKRKASSDEVEERPKSMSKRPKKQPSVESESEAETSSSTSSDDDDQKVPDDAAKDTITTAREVVDDGSTSPQKPRSTRSARSVRSRRPKREKPQGKAVRTIRRDTNSIVLAIPADFSKIKAAPPKKKRRPPPSLAATTTPRPHFAMSQSTQYATPFYAFNERENDELKSKPYGGILTETEADTSKTLPQQIDRERFKEAQQKAEEEWKIKSANAEAENETKGRSSQKLSGPPSKIKCINFGGFEVDTWYAAPYPEEYSRNRVLYICEFCLKYMNSDYVAWRHKLKCPAKHPPGDEIYRDKSISVFEVDGRKNPVYCQNLCLLAKLFLGSKTLYYDVEPFLFYIMTEDDEFGCHFVGYFSKEKRPSSQNNVSCILTLPIHQRKGYGNLLIDFSYLLTRVERKTGSPEKPLSDMGLVSYRNYWRLVLSYQLLNQKQPISITDISDRTGMTADDIVAALEALRALVRDPVTKTYALRLDYTYFKQCIDTWEAKGYVKLNPDALVWTPYIMGRSNLAHFDRAPTLPTIAPREGEEGGKAMIPEEGVQQQVHADAAMNGQIPLVNGDTAAADDEDTVTVDLYKKPTSPTAVKVEASSENATLLPAPMETVAGPPSLRLNATRTSPVKVTFDSTISQMSGASLEAPEAPTAPQIPPTRYEIFPPIPGTISRRKSGWRGGARRPAANTTSVATPIRRGGKNSTNSASRLGTPVANTGKPERRGKSIVNLVQTNGGKPEGRRTRSTYEEPPVPEAEEKEEESSSEESEGESEEEEAEKAEKEESEEESGAEDEGEEEEVGETDEEEKVEDEDEEEEEEEEEEASSEDSDDAEAESESQEKDPDEMEVDTGNVAQLADDGEGKIIVGES